MHVGPGFRLQTEWCLVKGHVHLRDALNFYPAPRHANGGKVGSGADLTSFRTPVKPCLTLSIWSWSPSTFVVCMEAFIGVCELAAATTVDDPCQIMIKGQFNGRATKEIQWTSNQRGSLQEAVGWCCRDFGQLHLDRAAQSFSKV